MRVDIICSWLRRVHRGSTGFLNDNIVMHQCHKIAVVLDHYRVVKVQWCPNHSMYEEICNQRMNTLFHARFKQAVQLILSVSRTIASFFCAFNFQDSSLLSQSESNHAYSEPTNRPKQGTQVEGITFNTEFISHNTQ